MGKLFLDCAFFEDLQLFQYVIKNDRLYDISQSNKDLSFVIKSSILIEQFWFGVGDESDMSLYLLGNQVNLPEQRYLCNSFLYGKFKNRFFAAHVHRDDYENPFHEARQEFLSGMCLNGLFEFCHGSKKE